MSSMHNKVALVIGGAHGVGAMVARLLVEAGAEVTLVDRDHLQGLAEAHRLGTAALYLHVDAFDQEQIQEAIANTIEVFGSLDVLVVTDVLSRGE